MALVGGKIQIRTIYHLLIMDYFSTFIQMLHAKKLSQNTILVYVSYIKPYLTYLEKL